MTSYRQIEANRRNALKSTGPKTEAGKQASRGNAIRHGLTAETVLSALEDAEDYKAFEAAITADYDAQSAVERELVLRLASILWRLRRATTMETGLFEIQAQHLHDYRQNRQLRSNSREVIHTMLRRAESFTRSKYWIAASRRRECAAFGQEAKLTSIANDPPATNSLPVRLSRSTISAFAIRPSFHHKPTSDRRRPR
jgi:hypothetical protein